MILRCMVCKKERELSTEEIKEYGEWIVKKELQPVDYLNRLSLDDGYTCKDTKKHKYEFQEEWDKEVHIVAKDISNNRKERTETLQRDTELEEKLREMVNESKELKNKMNELDMDCRGLGDRFKEMTGNKKYEIWI